MLPKIEIKRHKNIRADVCPTALDKFNPALRAAIEDEDTITIYDVIGESYFSDGVTVNRIDAALRSIGKDKDVTVLINSPGGDVFEGLAIYNRLREHGGEVTVKIMGLAASAASIIAMAGDRIEIGKAAFLMIHNAWVVAMGNKDELRDVADFLEPFDSALAGVYQSRTNISDDELVAMMDEETWLVGEAAISMGFADALLPSDQVKEGDEPKSNALRKVEQALTQNCDFSRSQARALLNEIKGKQDAAPSPSKTLDTSLASKLLEAITP